MSSTKVKYMCVCVCVCVCVCTYLEQVMFRETFASLVAHFVAGFEDGCGEAVVKVVFTGRGAFLCVCVCMCVCLC